MGTNWRRSSSARLCQRMSKPTIPGCRKYPTHCFWNKTYILRQFFPSTEPEPESDWEEVKAGESAENGSVTKEGGEAVAAGEESKVTLPDVPKSEPIDDGPAIKKQKPNDD